MPPLPPLPDDFEEFINDPDISPSSQILNIIFAFACTECTAEYLSFRGPPGFFAVLGDYTTMYDLPIIIQPYIGFFTTVSYPNVHHTNVGRTFFPLNGFTLCPLLFYDLIHSYNHFDNCPTWNPPPIPTRVSFSKTMVPLLKYTSVFTL